MYLPDDTKIVEAMRVLEMSDEALFEEIAHTDEKYAFVDDALDYGKRRYRCVSANVKASVCENQTVRNVFSEGVANRKLMLICAIADLIHTAGAMSVAAMLVREGVETYCVDVWQHA